ncbi:MAG: hypothetical protein JXA22_06720 [Candidatus Thermoplasmatota archaeon]|nr:hypothetical protein [Candidatus Thermoplasmatota archaeon]
MTDLGQLRGVGGAIMALLAFSFVAAALISDDLYSGKAEMGTQQDLGWWEADVRYGFTNGTIWIGENDNLLGIANYTEYRVSYSGGDSTSIVTSSFCISAGVVLALVTFLFGMLTSFRKVSWLLPFITGTLAMFMVLAPMLLIYNIMPDMVRSDLGPDGINVSVVIPADEMGELTGNLSHGSSFVWGFISIPFLVVAPLLMIGIRREKTPSVTRLSREFFMDDPPEPRDPVPERDGGDVKSGSMDDI